MSLIDHYPHLAHLGYFVVSDNLLCAAPDVVRAVMGCCLILEADHYAPARKGDTGGTRYRAVCEAFERHDGPSADAPYYEVKVVVQEEAPEGGGIPATIRENQAYIVFIRAGEVRTVREG